MAKKSSDTFVNEAQTLERTRQVLNDPSVDKDKLQDHLKNLCDEYEKLLEEARFITKVSDKLEAKLNVANEKLKANLDTATSENENIKMEREKVLRKNQKLSKEKTEAEVLRNKLQMTMTILIALLVVVVIMASYWLFLEELLNPGA